MQGADLQHKIGLSYGSLMGFPARLASQYCYELLLDPFTHYYQSIKCISALHMLANLQPYVCGSVTAVTIPNDLGLLLCTEAPVMTPNGVDFFFLE